nr:hypothetical protein [uncultured Pedobacter sp.]
MTRKNAYGKILGFIWLGVIGLIIISVTIQALTAKKVLKKKDFYGQYIIDRNYFKGKQADWQYNNFHFEIKENDSIYLYVMDKGKVVETFGGTITTVKTYRSERLAINMQEPTHHIISGDPTIYRETWSFYLVFDSPKFGNMFFKKGQWSPLDSID